ncbi:C-type lectin fold [Trinorchestia longiramus]|nr:C-type lectin fold [Trinorchestia longiramus]
MLQRASTSTQPPLDVNQIRATTISPEDGRLIVLAMPVYEKCQDRVANAVSVNASGQVSTFWISSHDNTQVVRNPVTNTTMKRTYTWVEARNHCRRKCMELVALNSPDKQRALVSLLTDLDIRDGVWTAGKRCLFHECNGIPEPVHVNGWYWASTGETLHPAGQTQNRWPENPWSNYGMLVTPQPDNDENMADESVIEACLAVQANPRTNVLGWHDVACDIKLGIVCEPAPKLVRYVERRLNVNLTAQVR